MRLIEYGGNGEDRESTRKRHNIWGMTEKPRTSSMSDPRPTSNLFSGS
jgi:hypothetical protein